MKKLQNVFLLLLVMIGFISCDNPIDPSKGGSNSFIGQGVELQIKDVENCTICEIQRYNLSKDSYSGWISLDYKTSRTVKDYFVEPGNNYKYEINYYSSNGVIESAKDTITVIADKGVGELTSITKPVASYDSETGIMTFSTLPKFSEVIESFINNTPNSSKNFSMSYFLQGRGQALYVEDMTKTINCTNNIREWAQDAYGKKLTFDSVRAYVSVDGVVYGRSLNHEDTIGIPNEIIVPDKRKAAIVENDINGVKINLPETSLDYIGRIFISKKNITDNIEVSDCIKIYNNGESFTKKDIIDYFIEPGKEYSYQVMYIGRNWSTKEIFKYSIPIKAEHGSGDLEIPKNSVNVTYDKTTGIMNLANLPTKISVNSNEYNLNSSMSYFDNEQNRHVWCSIPSNQTSLNWTTAHSDGGDTNKIFNKDLDLRLFDQDVSIDGIWYSRRYNKDDILNIFNNVPEKINIPDTRREITLKDNPNGIEIILPETVPSGVDYFTIGRTNVNHPINNGDMKYWYINVNDLTKKSVIDYFVTKDEEYEYTLYYRNNYNGDIVEKTKSNRIKAVNGGVEYLTPTTTVSYDENTTIMSITPKPDTSKLPTNSTLKLDVCYRDPNNQEFFGSIDKDGQINWFNILSKWENYNCWEQPLSLFLVRMEFSLDNVSYRQSIWNEDIKKIIPTIPEQIIVKDKRPTLILENNSEGIQITLPENVKDVTNVNISRWTDDINDSFTISKNLSNSSNTTTSLIDYFVEPNKEYNYKATFSNDNNSIRFQTKVSKITPTAGLGEVKIVNCPKATYANNIFEFTTIPDVSESINSLIKNKNGFNNIDAHYVHKIGENNWDLSIWTRINNSKANILNNIWSNDIDKYVDKNFVLRMIRSEIHIGDVQYRKDFKENKINHNIPRNIQVTDSRVDITLERVADGIKIVLPPEAINANVCIIERHNKQTNEIERIELVYGQTKPSSVIDYFVDKNMDYEYEVRFADDWSSNDNFEKSKKKIINSLNSGYGELCITNNPKAEFNKNTHIITVTELPVLDSKFDNLITSKNGIIEYRFGYVRESASSGGVYDQSLNSDQTEINYEHWLKKIAPDALILEFVSCSVSLDNIHYSNFLPLQNFSGFPQRIVY